jgi:hypothetical protein
MPGPLPVYKTNAARQRAYRQRKRAESKDEQLLAQGITVHAWALNQAIKAAMGAGDRDPVAHKVYRDDPIDTLRELIDHFHDQAGTPQSGRPWLPEE